MTKYILVLKMITAEHLTDIFIEYIMLQFKISENIIMSAEELYKVLPQFFFQHKKIFKF